MKRSESSKSVVRLRPDRGSLAFAAFVVLVCAALVGLAFSISDGRHTVDASTLVPLVSYCFIILPAPVCLAIWALVYRVQADPEGLRWRTIRGSYQVSWAEVTDYYVRLSAAERKGHDWLVIETTAGKIALNGNWVGDFDALRTLVQQQATAARATSWQLMGNRLEWDGPGYFDYRSGEAKMRRILVAIAIGIGPVLTIVIIGPKLPGLMSDPGRVYAIAGLALAAVTFNLYSLIPLMILPSVRDAARRVHQRIVVSVDGVAFSGSGADTRDAFLPWGEIVALRIASGAGFAAPVQFVIQGKDASITFTANITRLKLLKKVIALRATSAVDATREWKSDGADTEQLGGVASQWTGGYVGVGERIFRYRNHNVRALLSLATFYLVITQAPAVEAALGFNDRYVFDAWSVVWFVAPTALLSWTCWRYRAGGIIVSRDAVTECTPFGRRTIRWVDVESYRQVGEGSLQAYGVVRGRNGEKVRFWIAISDSEELMEIIRTRATRASGSWTQKDAILPDIDRRIGTE